MPASEIYFAASKGKLKLKGVQDTGIKKKKKKSKKDGPSPGSTGDSTGGQDSAAIAAAGAAGRGCYAAPRTQAELHFMERQTLREEQRIKKKAAKSHKEKVETFNRNLDSQSEHFDIPKVSWTK